MCFVGVYVYGDIICGVCVVGFLVVVGDWLVGEVVLIDVNG